MAGREQHLRDMAEMLCLEADAVGGWGSVTVRIAFTDHLPRQVDVIERHPSYRIGKGHPPLTGRGAGVVSDAAVPREERT